MQAETRTSAIVEIVHQHKNAPTVDRMRHLSKTIVIDAAGHPLQSDYDVKVTAFVAEQLHVLKEAARSAVRDLDASDELTFLRVKTKKDEIIVAHEKEFSIIAVRSEKDTIWLKRLFVMELFPQVLSHSLGE